MRAGEERAASGRTGALGHEGAPSRLPLAGQLCCPEPQWGINCLLFPLQLSQGFCPAYHQSKQELDTSSRGDVRADMEAHQTSWPLAPQAWLVPAPADLSSA